MSIGSALLFVCGVARVKSIRSRGTLIRSHLLFVRGAARVKSIRSRERHQSQAPCFFIEKCVDSLVMRVFRSKPLTSIGDEMVVG
jgi:hypothetical protein